MMQLFDPASRRVSLSLTFSPERSVEGSAVEKAGVEVLRKIIFVAGLLVLDACSGAADSYSPGGGGSQSSLPALAVTLAASSQNAEATDETPALLILNASYTGDPAGVVVPDVQVTDSAVALDGPIGRSGNTFTVKLKATAPLALGSYSGTVSFRLCRDQNCTEVYPGSTQKFSYAIDSRLADWTTLQRNAAHTGYVRARFDPAKFAQTWQVDLSSTESFGRVAVSRDAVVAVSLNRESGNYTAHCYDLASGRERWRRIFKAGDVIGDPGIAGDAIALTAAKAKPADDDGRTWSNALLFLRPADGEIRASVDYEGADANMFAPTTIADELLLAGGPSVAGSVGNRVYSFDVSSHAQRWIGTGSGNGFGKGQTPAADADYVYHYSGSLDVFRRDTGARVSSTDDPGFRALSRAFSGAPVVSSRKSVIAYSGEVTRPYFPETRLVSYNTESGRVNWTSAATYFQAPAVANGTIYAVSRDRKRIDALNEATGQVQWSIVAGVAESGYPVSNVIVTDNLIFFSTENRVYAVTVAAPHAEIWSAPVSGQLAISPDGQLIVSGRLPSNGSGLDQPRITAFQLR